MQYNLFLSGIVVGLLLLSGALPAYAIGNLHYSADTTITVGSFTLTIVGGSTGSDADATSLTINDNATVSVTVPADHTLTFTIPAGNSLVTSPTAVEQSCGTPNSLTIAGPNSFIVTPNATQCTKGIAFIAPAPAPAPTPTTVAKKEEPKTEIVTKAPTTPKVFTFEVPKEKGDAPVKKVTPAPAKGKQAQDSRQTAVKKTESKTTIAQKKQVQAELPDISSREDLVKVPTATAKKLPTIARNLGNGSKGSDVKSLQQALKTQGYDVKVSGIFDAKTLAAVKALQEALGLSKKGDKAHGYVGPSTQKVINELLGKKAAAVKKKAAVKKAPAKSAAKKK